ncbi:Mov34/MPN/PAD-1 family protein [Amphibacillus marinus]|nr:Mov34/MPN/PAD-1 family protein [Amphibacillus marinus]
MKVGIHINRNLVYTLPNNKILFIRPEALAKMHQYKQVKWRDTEAGGILIGRILIEDGNYIIDEVSEPMLTDKRTRIRFIRKPDGHQEYFNKIWKREKGTCFYFGEWHTHPQRIPVPSRTDRKEWNRLINISFEADFLFFIIIGIDDFKVYCGSTSGRKILELNRRYELG